MKINELRHFNYIYHYGRVNQISGYSAYHHPHPMVNLENNSGLYGIHTIEPIPITIEWLLNFGFTPNILMKKVLSYGNKNTSKPFVIQPNFRLCNPNINLKIEYVHQLQNLYFDIVGEELVFSSTEP